MKTSDVLVTWDLPTESLSTVAPKLKFIHIIGAGVEHLADKLEGGLRNLVYFF